MKNYFITDLDRTIIHAKHKGFKCVEYMDGKEITYMTENSYRDFLDVLKYDNLEFVPCTMRNKIQTLRVKFINEYSPKFMICSNGAQIYINGELDLEWDKYIRNYVNKVEILNNIKTLNNLELKKVDIRNTEEFYVTMKHLSREDAISNFEILKKYFEKDFDVLCIGIKIFIINKMINKKYAVDYIVEKYKMEKLITAGDSIVDEEFTKRGIAILPGHSSFKHKGAIITEKEGIYSTEELIIHLKNQLVY